MQLIMPICIWEKLLVLFQLVKMPTLWCILKLFDIDPDKILESEFLRTVVGVRTIFFSSIEKRFICIIQKLNLLIKIKLIILVFFSTHSTLKN